MGSQTVPLLLVADTDAPLRGQWVLSGVGAALLFHYWRGVDFSAFNACQLKMGPACIYGVKRGFDTPGS